MSNSDFEFFKGNCTIFSIAVSQNDHFVVACTSEGLQIWDAAALVLISLNKPENPGGNYKTCSFSQDNQHLAAGTTNGYLNVFAIKDFIFTPVVSVQPDGSSINLSECLFVNPSKILCTFGNSARIYKLDTLIQISQSGRESTVAVHPGVANTSIILPQKRFAVTLGKKTLCLWDIKDCKLTSSAIGTVGGFLLRLSADGKILLIYGDRSYIEVWEVETLVKTHNLIHLKQRNLPIGEDNPDESSPTDIYHCAVSINGIVVGGNGNGDLFVWYGENLEQIKELDAHESLITFVEFSPSGTAFVSADMEGTVMMWQIRNNTGRELEVNMIPLVCHDDSVEQVCFSSQGRRILSSGMDKCIHLYNGPSGDLISKLSGHNSGVARASFSSNESLIVSGDERGEIIIWDGFTGQLLQHIKPKVKKNILDLQFVRQDKYICSRDGNADYITVHEVSSGEEVSRLSFTTEIFTMSVSSFWDEAAYMVCCLKDGSVKFVNFLDFNSMNIIG